MLDTPLSSKDAIAAALPSGFTLQDVAIRVAGGVCEAYAAYNNGSNRTPVLPGYHSFHPIYVWEAAPNGNPFSGVELAAQAASAVSAKVVNTTPRKPAAYATPNLCTGPMPPGTPSAGSQLFGFTATADDGSHNILIFRGTVTLEEAGYDLLGWGSNTACLLPSQWFEQKSFGLVNSYLYDFYVEEDLGAVTSLAASSMNAIQQTSSDHPNLPWFVGAHSLGGAIASLAALDAVASGLLAGNKTVVITFGSLHVGDKQFADDYTAQVPLSIRVANLCDFVPSMVSLEPVIPVDPYVHVGAPATFVWQTWDDWGNHSLANIYQPMVQSHWDVIQWGDRKYPE